MIPIMTYNEQVMMEEVLLRAKDIQTLNMSNAGRALEWTLFDGKQNWGRP